MAELKGTDFIQDGYLDNAIAKMEQFKKTTQDAMQVVKNEFVQVKSSVESASAAHKAGQQVIEDSEKKTMELIKAQEKYEKSLQETEKELVRLKAATQEQNRINKLTEKLNRSAEGSYDKLSAQYSLNKIRLNAMSDAQRKGTKAGKELEKGTKEIYEQMKSLQEATGKNTLSVGDYAGQIGSLIPQLGNASQATASFGKQLWALVANPVGLIITAIVLALTGLYKAFTTSAAGSEMLEQSMAALGAVIETLLGRVAQFISGEITLKQLLFDTGKEMRENVDAAMRLVTARRLLEKTTVENTQAEARLEKQIAKLQIVRDSDAKSLSERRKAAEELTKVEVEQANVRLDQALDEAEVKAIALRSLTKGTEDYRLAQIELGEAMANVAQAQADLTRVQGEAANQLEMIRLDIFEQELDLLLDITDRQKSINERRIADEKTTIDEKRRLANENVLIIEDAFDKQIKAFEELNGVQLDEQRLLNMTGTEILKYADSLGFSERAVNRLREVVIEKLAADQDNLETLRSIEEQEKKIAELRDKQAKESIKRQREALEKTINQEIELRYSEIDIMKATEEEKTRLRLEAEKKRLIAILNLNKFFGKELSDLQIQTMKNTIEKIDQEIAALDSDPERKDIFSLLGIKVNDKQKEQINQSIQYIKDSVGSLLQTRLNAINELVAAREQEVDNARQNLDTQIALEESGRQADVEGAVKALNEKERARERALEQQKKAQKAQQRLQEAESAASLAVAVANIFRGFSSIPFVGQVLAIAAVASMFAAFASSKIQARNASKFGKGGEFDIEGGSHASGHDVSLGVHGGREIIAEGGEKAAIFSKSAVRRYGRDKLSQLIKDINSGDYSMNNSFEGTGEMNEIIRLSKGADSKELLEESRMLRRELKETIKSMPQSIQNWDDKGYREFIRQRETTRNATNNRNSY